MTDFDDFKNLAARNSQSGSLVPVWRDFLLDLCTPVGAFAKLRRGPFAFLLESAPAGGEAWSRYTYLGTEPRMAWRLRDRVVESWTPDIGWHGARSPADPLGDLREILRELKPVDVPELGPFWSGAVGFFSYDVARHIEFLPDSPPRSLNYPDACFVFTDALVVIDNWRGQARVIVSVPVPAGTDDDTLRSLHSRAIAKIEETIDRLRGPDTLDALVFDERAEAAQARSVYDRETYLQDVMRIKEYILAGDVFQVLLARRMWVPFDFESSSLYRALRALNPSPYMYHLVLDGLELVGSSPELLVRVADGKLTVRPDCWNATSGFYSGGRRGVGVGVACR